MKCLSVIVVCIALAPISGSASTTIQYVHTDHLGGTNVVTDNIGQTVQVLDFYPYGGERISTGTFDEKHKFAQTFRDDETEMDYAEARYYRSAQGMFISQDPVSAQSPTTILGDPQQFHMYSYARGNPVSLIDPSGLLTVVIPGTFHDDADWAPDGAQSDFLQSVSDTFGEDAQVLDWTGGNSKEARAEGAELLGAMVSSHTFAKGEKLNIIGHSHGGNVGVLYSTMTDRTIDNLVTLGTPVRSDYQPNMDNIIRHTNAYSMFDQVQPMLGGKAAGGIGGMGFGVPPLSYGYLGAGRMFDSANNVSATWHAGGLIAAHGNMASSHVWNSVVNGQIVR